MQNQSHHTYKAVVNGQVVASAGVSVGTSHADAWTWINDAFDTAREAAR